MRTPVLLALTATLALAACGGGGGSTTPPTTGGGGGSQLTSQAQSENAISTTESLGGPVDTVSSFNQTTSGVALATRSTSVARDISANSCVTGAGGGSVELFVPDKNGDPNSTEEQYFYDSACSQLARDVLRLYTTNGSGETVARTVSDYAQGNATAISVRTENVTFENGTFNADGYPVPADGFARSQQGALALTGVKTIGDDSELVLQPSTTGVNNFCGDGASYNQTGIAALSETFGGNGTSTGTRTVNGDGSVTWSTTHNGSTFKGAIGALSITVGAQNTACPIATPQFVLAGGTQLGNYTIPVTAQFLHGELIDLTVTGATLANGNSLSVTTNTSASPLSSGFITGTVSNAGTQIATFSVNAFGNGVLTVTSSGIQYVMNDWHVAK